VTDAGSTAVLLVGGSSDIGLAILRRLRSDGPVSVVLLGRDAERLQASSVALRRSTVDTIAIELVDAGEVIEHERAVASAFDRGGPFDVVVLAIGLLGAQAALDADPVQAAEVMRVNFLGAGSLMLHCLRRLRAQGRGTLIVLSTVATERPRASNAIYGAAKTGLDALAQGLGDGLAASGVRVLTVRPGFVITRMTAGLKPPPFATTPEAVADATVAALARRAHTVWVPSRLRWIFAVVRHIPRPLFRKLPL
jgi:decaprenylphospho-beta-D-erythro-pentofuranosid-2-ulose 2-reductase